LPKNDFELLYNGLLRIVDQLRNRVAAKILYIEDSKSIAEMTIAIMTNMGLLIDHYVNGEQAIQAFYANNYDLVITDIFVEGKLNGADIVNAIRKTETRKSRTPILAISGQNDIQMRLDVLNNGANDFISKPIQEDEFCARTNNLIALKRLFDQVDGQQKKLFEMAMTDQLTKLYNRHSLTEMAPKYISDGIRHNFDVSLLVIDLDHFKQVNDTYGHATGDIVLHQIGKLLKQLSRKEDFAARFGGEEFVMLLCHCHISHALEKAEMIRQKIEALKPAGLVITASIGVASTGQDKTMDFNKLFEKADKAVYDAKHSGRNQVQFSSSNKAA
ncbi:MAG: diguanylate cyclase, partial [Gammaproteobacteria bacterium]|nr:diguanylate cyclase [Gammaproteobacteria bacterium]